MFLCCLCLLCASLPPGAELKWESWASASDVWNWLEGNGQCGTVIFLGGTDGALWKELETWESRLENFLRAAISFTNTSMSSWSSSSVSYSPSSSQLLLFGRYGSICTNSVPLMSQRQYGQVLPADFCQPVRQSWHRRCPQGWIRVSLSLSAQILHCWKVLPISQYSSYCSSVTLTFPLWAGSYKLVRSGFTSRPSGYR